MKAFNQKAFAVSAILLLLGLLHASGQIKNTNLYDLILSGLPDSTAPANIVSWEKGISGSNPTVKGGGKIPKKDDNGGYYRKVFVNLDMDGKKIEEVNVDVSGKNLKGYSSFSITLPMGEDFAGVDINQLGKKACTVTPLKKSGDVLCYKVKFLNKKNVWIVLSEEYIASQSNWYVTTVYFDEAEYKKAIKK